MRVQGNLEIQFEIFFFEKRVEKSKSIIKEEILDSLKLC